MAKTNFSGPITAGKINNTTGFTPSQNVRNTGFVVMGQSFGFDSALLAADADSIATAASNPAGQGAGALTLTNTVDGTAASGSFVMPGVGATGTVSGALGGVAGAAKVCIGSTGNDTGINFTITGTDIFGNVQTEGAITGPNAAAGTAGQVLSSEGAGGGVEWIDAGVKSSTSGEPSGSDSVINIVSLTQAEYNAGTPVATTLYIIT